MALFGNDRPIMPSFRTSPELDSSARSPYDDLNRIERNLERNGRQLERDMREERNNRGRDRDERLDERHADPERNGGRQSERAPERAMERNEVNVERSATAAVKPAPAQPQREGAARPHALIEGLFDKLPEPETEWPLQARQKWLQTAANIFDLMYLPQGGDGGELLVRVERTSAG